MKALSFCGLPSHRSAKFSAGRTGLGMTMRAPSLEGRALAGFSTGGLPLGYRSSPERDQHDRIVGHRIEVDEEAAATIRRIFDEYLKGHSYAAIAQMLNRDSVPPPRAKTRHRRKGWVASTIRAMLLNEAYVGVWTFKKRLWQKVPGTNDRRSRARSSEQVIRREYPERRIIDVAVWDAVRARSAAVRARYTGKRAPGSAPGRVTNYPLSGLLHCGCCGAPMVITAGTSASYYKCGDYKERRTCSNSLGVKEELARTRIFSVAREVRSPGSARLPPQADRRVPG